MMGPADVEVAVAARNALPDLLDEIERLRAEPRLVRTLGGGWRVEADGQLWTLSEFAAMEVAP